MKIKKILFTIFIVIATLLIFNVKSDAALELNELDFDAQINSDGSMDVIETWDINVSETNTLFKTFKIDNSKYSSITEVRVTDISSNINFSQISEEMYHVTENCYYALKNSYGNFEIAWGVGLDNSSARKTYQISYKVNDAIAKYNDYAELYWQFIGDDFEINAKKINGTILLPHKAENKEDIRVWGHTQEMNGEIYVTDLNKIEFTINNYTRRKYVEVRSLIPLNMIETTGRQYNYSILDNVLQEETKWADEANAIREEMNANKEIAYKSLLIIFGILAAIFIIFLFKIFKKTKKLNQLKEKYKPTIELDYFREVPYEDATPGEALFMISDGREYEFSDIFSANILNLCLKRYIILEVYGDNEVKITILDKDIINLKDEENIILEFLKEVAKDGNQLTTKDITQYLMANYSEKTSMEQKIRKAIEKIEIENGNFLKENKKQETKYTIIFIAYLITGILFIPLIPIGIVLLINGILTSKIAKKINIFTQKGIDEKEKWVAFKNYMKDFSLLKDKEVPALIIWEKYLVYATVFGISDKVLEQLKVVYPEFLDVNSDSSYYYINTMKSVNIGKSIESSIHFVEQQYEKNTRYSSSTSSTYSSGSGAGGGFSGGGGGGRWPEVAVADANTIDFLSK